MLVQIGLFILYTNNYFFLCIQKSFFLRIQIKYFKFDFLRIQFLFFFVCIQIKKFSTYTKKVFSFTCLPVFNKKIKGTYPRNTKKFFLLYTNNYFLNLISSVYKKSFFLRIQFLFLNLIFYVYNFYFCVLYK